MAAGSALPTAPPWGAAHFASSSGAPRSVLLVSEQAYVREFMALQLRAIGCFPMTVASDLEAQRLVAQMLPDLVVIDLDTGVESDHDWALQLSRTSTGKAVRTVMLSADPAKRCGADGARCGADLCVPKPFDPRELMQQMLRLMQSLQAQTQRTRVPLTLTAAGIELDLEQPTVRLLLPTGWCHLDLPRTEHRLLAFLLSDAEKVRSREEIRDAVWHELPVDLRTVDQYIRRLRKTLDALYVRGLVKTVTGAGYRVDLAALKHAAR